MKKPPPRTSDKRARKKSVDLGAPLMSFVLAGVGLVLVGLGLGWEWVMPDSVFWSDAQAEEFEDAYAAAHAATIGDPGESQGGGSHDGHDHGSMTEPERVEARRRFEAIKGRLARAQSRRRDWGRGLAALGAATCVAGLWWQRRAAAS